MTVRKKIEMLSIYSYLYHIRIPTMWLLRHIKKGINCLVMVMLMTVMWLFFNLTVNSHTHLLYDGVLITHAHPFHPVNGDPDAQSPHKHSGNELKLLSLFSTLITTILVLLLMAPFAFQLLQVLTIGRSRREPARKYYQLHHYHAPPPA